MPLIVVSKHGTLHLSLSQDCSVWVHHITKGKARPHMNLNLNDLQLSSIRKLKKAREVKYDVIQLHNSKSNVQCDTTYLWKPFDPIKYDRSGSTFSQVTF